MAFNSRFIKSKKLPMTALFDVVFLLIIFFIVSTTLTGGGEDILGKNEIDTPRETGDTSSHILIQLFNMNNSFFTINSIKYRIMCCNYYCFP